MISRNLSGWARRLTVLGLVMGVLLTASAATAGIADVIVRVVDQNLDFTEDTTLSVEIQVDNVFGVAGLDFVLEYPSDLIAVEELSTHVNEGLWSLVIVNHDRNDETFTPPAGSRYISVAAADAVGREVSDGLLMTIDFPVSCEGFAQRFADGREFTIRVVDVSASIIVDGDVVPAPFVQGVDGTFTLNCTSVANGDASFGTLKSEFDTIELR